MINTISYRIKNTFRRIKRIADFLPILWRGRDFDYSYAIELFHYQLERIADFLESEKAYSINAKHEAKKIRTLIKLGEKVYDEDYLTEWQRKIEEEYGPNALKFHFENTGKDDGTSYLKYNYEYWDNAKDIKSKVDFEFNKSAEKQKKAERIYWEYIHHNIRRWWD